MEKMSGRAVWRQLSIKHSILVLTSEFHHHEPFGRAYWPFFQSIILDGEMLVWDPVSERNLPFGTLKTAALGKWDVTNTGFEIFTML